MSEGITTVAYIGASILFIMSLGGLSNQETARRGNIYGIVGMAIAMLATILSTQIDDTRSSSARSLSAAPSACLAASRVEMTQMPQLVAILHSLSAWRPCWSVLRPMSTRPAYYGGREDHSRGRDFPGRIYRRDHVYRVGYCIRQAAGQHFGQAAAAAGAPLAEPRAASSPRSGWASNFSARPIRCRSDAAAYHGGDRLPDRHPPGDGYRRRGYAGRCVHAEQLFRLGGGGDGLHAGERPADRRRRAGGLVRRDPQLHHVQGDEPQFISVILGGFGTTSGSAAAAMRAGRSDPDLRR